MKLKLDPKKRKFIQIPIEDENGKEIGILKYFEKNTKQVKQMREAAKEKNMIVMDELNEQQFFENLQGDQDLIAQIKEFHEENGNLYVFMNDCDKELGKQSKKD